MPTRTTETNPFAPRDTLTREDLLAYAEGRLAPDRQHAVELHLEVDPLLAEAVEGMQQARVRASLRELDAKRPSRVGHKGWWIAGGAVIVVVMVLLIGREQGSESIRQEPNAGIESPIVSSHASAEREVVRAQEIASATEQPESMRIGHEVSALHARSVAEPRIVRDSIERIPGRTNGIGLTGTPAAPRDAHRSRVSRELIFLHDLKLVHPTELYAEDPVVRLSEAGVLARYADRPEQARAGQESVPVPYTAFMDEAIGRFAASDHKGSLDDLRHVLGQYPEDVNALFYGGLCAYNLGLFERARMLLHRAATHPIDVFDEEAAWYHALALERMGERSAATDAFERIAAAGGFYSSRAAEKLQALPAP
ncbi:MAG: hypothetical protein IPM46_07680 [Flavobacteriales bacterium]|nr:hypothetical protein [Flavobacteriales bacterium]